MLSMQLKLSELVLAMHGAENKFASIEDLTDEEREAMHSECRIRAETMLDHIEERRGETGRRTAAHAAKTVRKAAHV
jgi:low affinity Fe/Cu permease